MIRVLIPYGTSEGHTARIAEYLADVIRHRGHEAYPVEIKRSDTLEPSGYDAVMVGASVHGGKHQRSVRNFVKKNRQALERLPSAFFSVSLAAQEDTEGARKEVERYLENFVQQTGWRPRMIRVFAGALLYTQYGFVTRWIMRKIAREKGSLDLDTSRDYEYTDWQGVKRFAEQFLQTLTSQEAAGLARAG